MSINLYKCQCGWEGEQRELVVDYSAECNRCPKCKESEMYMAVDKRSSRHACVKCDGKGEFYSEVDDDFLLCPSCGGEGISFG